MKLISVTTLKLTSATAYAPNVQKSFIRTLIYRTVTVKDRRVDLLRKAGTIIGRRIAHKSILEPLLSALVMADNKEQLKK